MTDAIARHGLLLQKHGRGEEPELPNWRMTDKARRQILLGRAHPTNRNDLGGVSIPKLLTWRWASLHFMTLDFAYLKTLRLKKLLKCERIKVGGALAQVATSLNVMNVTLKCFSSFYVN